jgi:hypothetical protein
MATPQKSNFMTLRIIWCALLGSLGVYVVLCHMLAAQGWSGPGDRLPVATIRYVMVGFAPILLVVATVLRKKLTAPEQQVSATTNPAARAAAPAKVPFQKYSSAMVVSLVISEAVGVFGLMLFFLGDGFVSLYFFVALSGAGMIYLRPKQEEVEI